MPRQVFCSTAVQVLLCCASATYVLCTHPGDPNLKLLLQKGVDQGYPGIAVLIQSADGRTQSAAAGYSDLENHTPMRVEDAFHIASINKTFTAGRDAHAAHTALNRSTSRLFWCCHRFAVEDIHAEQQTDHRDQN